ncbi:MAG: hypothetical protein AAGA71_06250 [Pseudomonadota bacterium]
MIELIGIFAGLFVVLAFYTTDHVRLRQHAIVSNVLFIWYALYLKLWPIIVLHAVLLLLNWKRLSELRSIWERSDSSLHMSDKERAVFVQGLKSNAHSWAMYGCQRVD